MKKVEVLKVSERGAALLTVGKNEVWIMPKSYTKFKETGRLSKKIMDELAQEKALPLRYKVEPDWENDSCIGVDEVIEFTTASSLSREKEIRVFIPKSQIDSNSTCPLWLIAKKVNEAIVKNFGAEQARGWIWCRDEEAIVEAEAQ